MARWSKENPAPYMPNAAGNNGAARVKLQRKYFDALLADFAEHGEAAIKIMRIEEPSAYIRVIASLMPRSSPSPTTPSAICRTKTCSSFLRERRQCSRS